MQSDLPDSLRLLAGFGETNAESLERLDNYNKERARVYTERQKEREAERRHKELLDQLRRFNYE